MRILYVATIGGFMPFFKTFIRELLDEGHEVDIATNMMQYPLPVYYKEWGCGIYQISCLRSPLSKGNIDCVREIKKLVSDKHYDMVHCHTPIAAACTRLACRKARKNGTKVIYTAHGFHFYTGAPLKNWLLFYPVEKLCSRWTDALITINKEDYERAKKKFKIKTIEYVPGVGIDVGRFANDPTDKKAKRRELGIPEDAYVLLSVGELNVNKNQQIVVRAVGELKDKTIHYIIAGRGNQEKVLLDLAKEVGIEDQFNLIGFRSDVPELYRMADVYLLPSIREGLNVSVMEAMSSGLPCIVSDIRGNRDMIDEGKGGFLVDPLQQDSFKKAILSIREKKDEMGKYNAEKAVMFESSSINSFMKSFYRKLHEQ